MPDIFFYPYKEPEYAGFVSSAGDWGRAAGQGFWKKYYPQGGDFFQNLHDLVLRKPDHSTFALRKDRNQHSGICNVEKMEGRKHNHGARDE